MRWAGQLLWSLWILFLVNATNDTSVTIAPGVDMPWISFGAGSQIALKHGGRALDTAWCYGDADQFATGKAVREGVVSRAELFVTTKVPCCPSPFAFNTSLCSNASWDSMHVDEHIHHDFKILGLEYVDLLLMHWPCAKFEQTLAVYRKLEALARSGRARAIGVSNFNATELEALAQVATVRPAVNQVGFSIGGHAAQESSWGRDEPSLAKAQELGITYMAYSPLGGVTGIDVLHHPTVQAVAAAHGRSAAQVALRWLIQRGAAVVTASDKISHITADLDALTFNLTESEMVRLSAVHAAAAAVVV